MSSGLQIGHSGRKRHSDSSTMEYKEIGENPVALKVMRLTRPTFTSPQVVTCDSKDLPGNLLNEFLREDAAAVAGTETLAAGRFLVVPQSFGNIYLGETFSCYLCVHNVTEAPVRDVTVKADLQTNSQHIPLATQHRQPRVLGPEDTVDDVIHHEVKDVGTHILMCEVAYLTSLRTPASFRKFFKFQVMKPLDVKTKFFNADEDEVYLEAQIQNITSGPICLERVSLECPQSFGVVPLNAALGDANVLQPQACCQYLYRLASPPANGSDMGKLDIVWRSNLGEKGRLQTSQLQRRPLDQGDVRLSFESLPSSVRLETPFDFDCKIVNASERRAELSLRLRSSETSGFLWSGVSDRSIGALEPGATTVVSLRAFPVALGLQAIAGISLIDAFLKRTYDYDDLASIFVM